MAQGFWQPVLLVAVVVGLVVSAANRAGGDEQQPAAEQPAPAAEPASAAEPARAAGLTRVVVPVAAAPPKPPPGSATAPVPAVDEIGTRRLTGRAGATVALTFDDGPHPSYTPEILEILRAHGVVATFCVVGRQVSAHPDLVRAIAADRHALCNHTVTHDTALPSKDDETINDEIKSTQDAVRAAVPGAEVTHYRAPGGNFAANVNAVVEAHDLTPLGWSIDTQDWRRPGAEAIRARAVEGIHPGAVILLHDGGGDRAGTVAALPAIISAVHDLGYEFVVPVQ